jgi:uncharacterized protein (TIGR02757 family)
MQLIEKKKLNSRQAILDCYRDFHDPSFLDLDPLMIIRTYLGTKQAEEIALNGALFAFGAVKQIQKSLEKSILLTSGVDLYAQKLDEPQMAELLFEALKGFRHRIYVDRDLVLLKLLYRRSLLRHGSLENHFLKHHREQDETIEAGLCGLISDYRKWVEEIRFKPGPHFHHMLNSPEQKSACKRWVMFLKWVVRKDDGMDLGIWKNSVIRTDQLVIPMDTHLWKISRNLKLTNRKSVNWLTALDVTRSLKKIDAQDPTRFDFSLCRYGMLKYRKRI